MCILYYFLWVWRFGMCGCAAAGQRLCTASQLTFHPLCPWSSGPTAQLIEEGVQFALRERAAGQPVYIHCAHGHGRSATVMAAAFIASGLAKDAVEAVDIMRRERPRVRLNKRQVAALQWWWTSYGKRPVKYASSKRQ